MTRIAEFANAKVNLTLRVLGRRPDGYHEIESLVAFASGVADRVAFEPDDEPKVWTAGPLAAMIAGENLAAKALDLLGRAGPRLRLGAVTIEKNIPVAAGLGGGSADAAAVLRAVRRANPDLAETVDWLGIARKLGADVPVCLQSRASFMRGIGECVSPLAAFPPLFAVLVNTGTAVPSEKTSRVFRALGAAPLLCPLAGEARACPGLDPGRGGIPTEETWNDILIEFIHHGANGLEAPARVLMPEIAEVLDAIGETLDCMEARLSGAGPTCFGLYRTADAAGAGARDIARGHPEWWVKATALR